MSSTYIYAGTRAKTLERMLLSETQMELLTSAKSAEEAEKVLYDTYLASFLGRGNETSVKSSIDQSMIDAKETLEMIAPEREILDLLWIKYDFHNLKTILKGKKINLSDDQILGQCFSTGTIAPEKILKSVNDQKLGVISTHLERARIEAEDTTHVVGIDHAMQKHYFAAIREIAENTKEEFVKKFVRLLIDLFNIKAGLRADAIEGIEARDVYVPGGSFQLNQFESKESIFALLDWFGGEALWKEAVDHFNETGKYNRLEKIADDYVTGWLKDESISIFTPAALFSFFYARKNNAQMISAILTAKRAGMPEVELRTILRRLHA